MAPEIDPEADPTELVEQTDAESIRSAERQRSYLEKWARGLAGQDMTVAFSNDPNEGPHVDYTESKPKVTLPSWRISQPATDIDRPTYDVLMQHALLLHELGHLSYTADKAFMAAVESLPDENVQQFKKFAHVFEDSVIESRLRQEFSVHEELEIKNANYQNQPTGELSLFDAVLVSCIDLGIYDTGTLRSLSDETDDSVQFKSDEKRDVFISELFEKIVETLETVHDTTDSIERVEAIYESWKEIQAELRGEEEKTSESAAVDELDPAINQDYDPNDNQTLQSSAEEVRERLSEYMDSVEGFDETQPTDETEELDSGQPNAQERKSDQQEEADADSNVNESEDTQSIPQQSQSEDDPAQEDSQGGINGEESTGGDHSADGDNDDTVSVENSNSDSDTAEQASKRQNTAKSADSSKTSERKDQSDISNEDGDTTGDQSASNPENGATNNSQDTVETVNHSATQSAEVTTEEDSTGSADTSTDDIEKIDKGQSEGSPQDSAGDSSDTAVEKAPQSHDSNDDEQPAAEASGDADDANSPELEAESDEAQSEHGTKEESNQQGKTDSKSESSAGERDEKGNKTESGSQEADPQPNEADAGQASMGNQASQPDSTDATSHDEGEKTRSQSQGGQREGTGTIDIETGKSGSTEANADGTKENAEHDEKQIQSQEDAWTDDIDSEPDVSQDSIEEYRSKAEQRVQKHRQNQQNEAEEIEAIQETLAEIEDVMLRELEVVDGPEAGQYRSADVADVKQDSRRLARILDRTLQEKKRSEYRHGMRQGEIDTRVAHRLEFDDFRVFQRRTTPDEKEYDTILILDRSGSMASDIEGAERSAASLAMALEEIDISTCIIDMFENSPRIAKPFGVEIDSKLDSILTGDTEGGTPLSPCLQLARKHLEKREDFPFIIVITDGQPSNEEQYRNEIKATNFPVLGVYLYSNARTRDQVPNSILKRGNLFDRRKIITDPNELTKALRQLCQGIMF